MEWIVQVFATPTCDIGPLPINGIFSVPLARTPCDNAPDEKGIRWNQLMYW